MNWNTAGRFAANCFLIVALFAIGAGASAQTVSGVISEGKSFDRIQIGTSTESDVVAHFGTAFKLLNHQNYSFEMRFKELGLGFYYCYNDPNKEIFTIKFQAPSRVVTSKGIVLGKSTFADVFRIYGRSHRSSAGFEYDGLFLDTVEDNEGEDVGIEIPPTEKLNKATDGTNTSQVPIDLRGSDLSGSNLKYRRIPVSNAKKARDLAELKRSVVQRIELIEKGGVRQCGVRFPRKNS